MTLILNWLEWIPVAEDIEKLFYRMLPTYFESFLGMVALKESFCILNRKLTWRECVCVYAYILYMNI